MPVIAAQVLGTVIFAAVTVLLGIAIRRRPTAQMAITTSRVSRVLYILAVALPCATGLFYPGLTHYDQLLGLHGLPLRGVFRVLGLTLMLVGAYYATVANVLLWILGDSAATVKATEPMVETGVYQRLRHPMSMGYYLLAVGLGLFAGSTSVTMIALLLIVPAHVFNLKYFEEHEMAARYGQSYLEYKARVPFLPRIRLATRTRAAAAGR